MTHAWEMAMCHPLVMRQCSAALRCHSGVMPLGVLLMITPWHGPTATAAVELGPQFSR